MSCLILGVYHHGDAACLLVNGQGSQMGIVEEACAVTSPMEPAIHGKAAHDDNGKRIAGKTLHDLRGKCLSLDAAECQRVEAENGGQLRGA
jgi:hypothetical protein